MPAKRKQPAPVPNAALPKPQGGRTKRTPTSAFDPDAGKDIYEPEKVVAQRLVKGVTQYHVKWVGFESKSNTWEPIHFLPHSTLTK